MHSSNQISLQKTNLELEVRNLTQGRATASYPLPDTLNTQVVVGWIRGLYNVTFLRRQYHGVYPRRVLHYAETPAAQVVTPLHPQEISRFDTQTIVRAFLVVMYFDLVSIYKTFEQT